MSEILKDALTFLKNTVIEERVIKHGDRAEADRFFKVPYSALEEAVVNAVYHRSYEIREPIEVRVLPDEITVSSYPGLDRSVSIKELQSGRFATRRYRNRRIGEFLKELSLTEGRGTGIRKMLKAMRANGSPPPVFETDRNRTYFLVRLPLHPPRLSKRPRNAKARRAAKSPAKSPAKSSAKSSAKSPYKFFGSASSPARRVKSRR